MYLVTGATGNVGSQVVRELRARGERVRAFVRDRERARRLGDDVELALGDFADDASVRRALDGVETLFLSSGDGPEKVGYETGVIDAAATAGIGRIVKLSTVGAAAGSPAPFFDAHGRIEDHLRGSGVRTTILRACFSMTNLLAAAEQVAHTGRLFAPAEGARIAIVDPRDVGAAAAAVLVGSGHDGETLVLTGPEAITYERIAAEIGAATGRDVQFVAVPDETARGGLTGAGLSEWLADALVALFVQLRQGAAEGVTDTVEALTGRPPRSFAEFAREHAEAFGGSPLLASTTV